MGRNDNFALGSRCWWRRGWPVERMDGWMDEEMDGVNIKKRGEYLFVVCLPGEGTDCFCLRRILVSAACALMSFHFGLTGSLFLLLFLFLFLSLFLSSLSLFLPPSLYPFVLFVVLPTLFLNFIYWESVVLKTWRHIDVVVEFKSRMEIRTVVED